MAITTIKSSYSLDDGWILTPERYHPGRQLSIKHTVSGVFLGDLVEITTKSISPKALEKNPKEIYVLDTGHVHEGRIRGDREISTNINSQKKLLKPEDVIISRLRPYLRQVGFVDVELINNFQQGTLFACSTEFYVLSPKSSDSIAFLVPYLLSESIQTIFSNAVEGSQHPRFNEDVLLSLMIPETILDIRKELSEQVTDAIRSYREYEQTIYAAINNVTLSLNRLLA